MQIISLEQLAGKVHQQKYTVGGLKTQKNVLRNTWIHRPNWKELAALVCVGFFYIWDPKLLHFDNRGLVCHFHKITLRYLELSEIIILASIFCLLSVISSWTSLSGDAQQWHQCTPWPHEKGCSCAWMEEMPEESGLASFNEKEPQTSHPISKRVLHHPGDEKKCLQTPKTYMDCTGRRLRTLKNAA